VLAACGGGEQPRPAAAVPAPAPAPEPPSSRPESLYASWGCAICHGSDRRGGKNAPSLAKLDSSWSVETLADYLKDPARWRASDARIGKLARRYPKLTMPPTDRPEADRRAVAAWLLAAPPP
jgi:mono/diheme cytochrome c family protein